MTNYILKAEKRDLSGRKVKKLRKEGVVPANIFGKKIKSESIQVKLSDFEKAFKEAGETNLLELQIGKDKKPVLIHNVQHGPIKEEVLHVDFLQVNLKEKVSAEIPVEMVGESPAEKQGLGTVVQYINEVEVEALPTDLPEKFEIDLGIFTEVDQSVYLKDLKYDKTKVEIKEDIEKIVAKVEPVKEEKEEAPVAEAPTEGETGGEVKESAEGEIKEQKTQEDTSQPDTSKNKN